jgi:5'-3' exonuclease
MIATMARQIDRREHRDDDRLQRQGPSPTGQIDHTNVRPVQRHRDDAAVNPAKARVSPDQAVEVQTLVGDATDNVPVFPASAKRPRPS